MVLRAGNAFVATADNPSAIYLQSRGYHATRRPADPCRPFTPFPPGYDYTSPTGATASADSKVQPIPQLYYVNTLKDYPFSFGLGVYVPFGLSIDLGQGQSVPHHPRKKADLIYMNVNPGGRVEGE
jgi:long-subunit fatty acid transport protein